LSPPHPRRVTHQLLECAAEVSFGLVANGLCYVSHSTSIRQKTGSDGDRALPEEKRCTLDRLYQDICDGLDALLRAVGLKIAA
jgi:hypothetical protein